MRNKPNLILCSDIHLRERDANPVCRLDNHWETQWRKLDFISELQLKYDCPVICGGDLYDKWKPSPDLISNTIEHLPDQFYTVYGQHDLPNHSLKLKYKSGIFTLKKAGALHVMPECSWKQIPKKGSSTLYNILVWHIGNYQGQEPYPGCPDPKARTLLKKYPQFDLIVTGDNHKPFVEEYEGRLLVNPGSMIRMDADQVDHKPRVYLWYAETNTVKPVYIPIENNVISREHLEIKKKNDNRMSAFIFRLNSNWEIKLNYEENLVEFEKVNKIRKPVMDIVYKSLEN